MEKEKCCIRQAGLAGDCEHRKRTERPKVPLTRKASQSRPHQESPNPGNSLGHLRPTKGAGTDRLTQNYPKQAECGGKPQDKALFPTTVKRGKADKPRVDNHSQISAATSPGREPLVCEPAEAQTQETKAQRPEHLEDSHSKTPGTHQDHPRRERCIPGPHQDHQERKTLHPRDTPGPPRGETWIPGTHQDHLLHPRETPAPPRGECCIPGG